MEKSKKSILFFHHTSMMGGATVSGKHLLKYLGESNFDLNLVVRTIEKGQALEYFEDLYKCKVIDGGRLPCPVRHYSGSLHFFLSIFFLKNLFDVVRQLGAVKRLMREEKPDIIILNSMTIFWVGLLAPKSAHKICYVRETLAKQGRGYRNAWIQKLMRRTFNKIIFISNFDARSFKAEDEKKVVIHNPESFGKSPEFLASTKLENRMKVILFLGGVNRLKGTITLLRAFRDCLDQGEQLMLILAGVSKPGSQSSKLTTLMNPHLTYRKRCESIIEYIQDKYPENIELAYLSKDTEVLYAKSDLVVFCPRDIHQSRLIFEAANRLKPILVPDAPNFDEFQTPGAVYRYKHNDVASLSASLKRFGNLQEVKEEDLLRFYDENKARHAVENYVSKWKRVLK